jgi:hypothetical protein
LGLIAWVWIDGVLLAFFNHFCFSLGLFYLSELVRYLHIERHLAAKCGTISLALI